ncbi:MAG TPA: formylglycine-generating enzyme family protein [Accumulibacter sp.]|nr:formylglycine-generating enzyme family protein [Accumulibacter sp.]
MASRCRSCAREAIHDHPTLAAQTLRVVEADGAGGYRLTLGSPRDAVTLAGVAADAELTLDWRWAAGDNGVRPGGDSVLLRAGTLPQASRACTAGWPARSLAVIAAPYSDAAARQLAIRLLDKGSADQVLVGNDWQSVFDTWRGPSPALNRDTQILLIVPAASQLAASQSAASRSAAPPSLAHAGAWAIVAADDLAALARAIDFPGARPLTEVAAPWRVLAAQGEVRVYGGPEKKTANGHEWLNVCPGSFSMGSSPGEALAYKNEIVEPERVVTLSRFDIAVSETTRRQYAQTPAGQAENDDRPVTDVDWQQARAHCRRLGGDLPSEAQWEYAARGGSRSAWSFGDDRQQLGRYAWFAGNSGGQTHLVQQKRPNPLGLYDMHGNVMEWTRDGYGSYVGGSFVDPENTRDTGWRVVRGGSFGFSPEDLRSAFRFGVEPARGDWDLGFRCVRVPPQP